MEYEYDPLEYECDPLNLQVMSDETNGEAEIEGRDLSDKSTNQGNDDNPMIDQVINEATKVTSKETIESSGLEILESVQPTGKSVSVFFLQFIFFIPKIYISINKIIVMHGTSGNRT